MLLDFPFLSLSLWMDGWMDGRFCVECSCKWWSNKHWEKEMKGGWYSVAIVDESGALFGGQFETSPITRELLVPPSARIFNYRRAKRNSLANGVIKTLQRDGGWTVCGMIPESNHSTLPSHQTQNIIKAIPVWKLPCIYTQTAIQTFW
jgi:hypothetical protein